MPRHHSHRQSALIKAYAAAEGIGERAAQTHRKNNNPRWQAFLQSYCAPGNSGKGMALATVPAPSAVSSWKSPSGGTGGDGETEDDEFAGLGLEEEAVKRHEALWRASAKAAREAAGRGDADKSAYFSQIATHNYRSMVAARKDLERAQINSRNLIPAGEFTEFATLVSTAAAIARGIVRELGEKVNPDHPDVGIAVLTEWVEQRWNPAIDEVIAAAVGARSIDEVPREA